ncbi:ribosome silencing factor [Candidatus Aerophobetes bacterium]|uniref:Ribosomal silencing factor RsfS n=1 Tax=Aerophobetes bacterium TaxID=2030807 RepID=A0A662DD62_UNCAE|nr:MAG: ribosome silencing factor [Candidatus Aerophobetes bacterium]
MTSKKLALEATRIAEEKKAREIVLLDLRGISVICDYFLICSGESFIHMRTIARELEEKLSRKGINLLNTGEYLNERWILLDFGDLVVHIFSPEAREYYQLERVWADAKRKDIGDFSRKKKEINI